MDDKEISYKTLRKIQQAEKNTPKITLINKEFYHDVLVFLKQLEKRIQKEGKPQKQMLLAEERQNIEKIFKNIYEQREKKIMLAAISKARGGNPTITSLLTEEKKLFDKIYENISLFRKNTLFSESLAQSYKKNIDKSTEKTEETKKKTNNKTKQITNDSIGKKENKHPILRINKNIPSFIGTDKNTYTLHKGDIISLPTNIAHILLEKNVADPIKKSYSNNDQI